MSQVLIPPSGSVIVAADDENPEDVLRSYDTVGQVVDLNIHDEHVEFEVWMGIDPAQPVNTRARALIADMAGLHIMCFGPVLLVGLEENDIVEAIRG